MATPDKKNPSQRPAAPVIDLSRGRTAAARKAPQTVPRPAPSGPPRKKLESSPPQSGFDAQIDGASMADLVQLECLRGLTRAVRIQSGENVGFLYFDDGQLVHAIAGSLSGEAAALAILAWEEGSVRPSDSYWIHSPTITTNWQGLLMVAAQRQDEVQRGLNDTHVSLGSPPPHQALEKDESMSQEFTAGVTRGIRMKSDGTVVRGAGEVGDLPDAISYATRLAELMGEALALGTYRGFECATSGSVLISYVDGDDIVATEAPAQSDVSFQRERAGT